MVNLFKRRLSNEDDIQRDNIEEIIAKIPRMVTNSMNRALDKNFLEDEIHITLFAMEIDKGK